MAESMELPFLWPLFSVYLFLPLFFLDRIEGLAEFGKSGVWHFSQQEARNLRSARTQIGN